MSWTPDVPIGFDPCGCAFGAVRKPYSAKCNFFADSLAGPNRINWYIVPDGTPIYDGITPFWPRVDVPDDQADTVFEQEGPGRTVRTFDWMIAFVPPAPHGVHGDAQDFLGLSPSDKYGPNPDSPCDVVRVRFAGVEIGALLAQRIRIAHAGVQLGCRIIGLPAPVGRAGVALGALLVRPRPVSPAGFRLGALVRRPLPTFTAGLYFGARVSVPIRVIDAGLQLGAKIVLPPPPSAGLQLGAVIIAVPSSMLTRNAGIKLGATLTTPTPGPTAGLGTGAKVSSPLPAVDAGVQLGATVSPLSPTHTAGLALNAIVSTTTPTLTAGISMGGSLSSPVPVLTAGLQLGGSVS